MERDALATPDLLKDWEKGWPTHYTEVKNNPLSGAAV